MASPPLSGALCCPRALDVVSLQVTGLAISAERATELIAIGLVVNAEIIKPRAHWLPATVWLVAC